MLRDLPVGWVVAGLLQGEAVSLRSLPKDWLAGELVRCPLWGCTCLGLCETERAWQALKEQGDD